MSAGFPTTLGDINSRAGSLATALRDTLEQIDRFNTFIVAQPDTFFTGQGMAAADLTVLRAAFIDMDNLYKIAHAQGTQPAANDFFWNAKLLCGVV